MKLKVNGVEIEVGSPAEAAELLAALREHEVRQGARAEPRRGRPPKVLQLVPPAPAQPMTSRSLADVDTASIDWLWYHRIPRAMVTVLYADPGVGKGTLVATLAAVTTIGGELPESVDARAGLPGSVLYVVAEDNPALTLRPRLEAAGADVARVHVFGPELRLRLPDHAANIEEAAESTGAELIVIDPLRGVMDGDSRPKVRKALMALEDIASRTGAAVLVVHHTNRQGSLHGSQDIIGIPRSVLRVDVAGGVRSVVPEKKNLAPDVEPVYFKIATKGEVGVVEWCDPPGDDVEDDASADEVATATAEQVLAELQLKVERPTLEGGVMWDAGAGQGALTLTDVASIFEVSPRSLRVRIRRGTAAALVACAATVGRQRYWARSAIDTLIERGLERVGKRTPGSPPGTGATPEENKLSEAFVRELLLKHAGSIKRAAESISMSRIQLRRRVTELGLDDYARQLQAAAGSPRFAPAPAIETEATKVVALTTKVTKRRKPTARAAHHCACCERPIGNFKVCVDCTKCVEVDGEWKSAGTCPRPLAAKLRPVTPAQVEAEMRAAREKKVAPVKSAPTTAPVRGKEHF